MAADPVRPPCAPKVFAAIHLRQKRFSATPLAGESIDGGTPCRVCSVNALNVSRALSRRALYVYQQQARLPGPTPWCRDAKTRSLVRVRPRAPLRSKGFCRHTLTAKTLFRYPPRGEINRWGYAVPRLFRKRARDWRGAAPQRRGRSGPLWRTRGAPESPVRP
jgi:hypothetical protein